MFAIGLGELCHPQTKIYNLIGKSGIVWKLKEKSLFHVMHLPQ
jgi:hypothetical protein